MHDLFVEIFESLRRNKLRTFLTGLSVSWGIFMLIVLLGAGNGVLNAFVNNEDGIDANRMDVYAGSTSKPYDGLQQGRRIYFSEKDIALTESDVFADHIDDVASVKGVGSQTMTSGKKHFNTYVTGIHPMFQSMRGIEMKAGRFIDRKDIEEKRKVVVINHMQAKNILRGSTDYKQMLGRRVRIGNLSYVVVGVRRGYENENDTDIYIPFSTAMSIYGSDNHIWQFSFTFHGLKTQEENSEFEKQYRATVNRAHRAAPDDGSAIYIRNRFTQQMQMDKALDILETSLWILGLLTLLGGIVGVSNIMLITVKERTHEFGIRKAIGAKPWSLMKLIVSESVLITAVFGYVGMFLGMLACELLDATLGQSSFSLFGQSIQVMKNPSVDLSVAVGVTVVLIVAGTLAGLVPSMKAARVRPIEALRAG